MHVVWSIAFSVGEPAEFRSTERKTLSGFGLRRSVAGGYRSGFRIQVSSTTMPGITSGLQISASDLASFCHGSPSSHRVTTAGPGFAIRPCPSGISSSSATFMIAMSNVARPSQMASFVPIHSHANAWGPSLLPSALMRACPSSVTIMAGPVLVGIESTHRLNLVGCHASDPAFSKVHPFGVSHATIRCLIPIVLRFIGSVNGYADVLGLIGAKFGELRTEFSEVQSSDLFIQVLGKGVHFLLIVRSVLP